METAAKRTIFENIFIGLLCCVALVMPWHKVLPSPLLTLAALVAIFAGSPSLKWNRLRSNRAAFIFASLYLITIAGYLLSENKSEAIKDLQLKISILLIPIMLCAFIEMRMKEVVLILRCFVLSCIAFALFALSKATYDYFSTGATHFYYKELVEFTFIHPSYIAMFEVFSIMLLLFKLFSGWKSGSGLFKTAHIAVILFLLLFVFLLTSKMAILSLFILVNFIIWLFVTPVFGRLKTGMILGAINIAGLLLILILPTTRERFLMLFQYNEVEYANSVDSREEIWKSAVEVSREHLLTGVGSGDAEDVLVAAYEKNGFRKGVEERYNAHNQYLQTVVDAGIFSLLLFLFVFVFSIRLALKQKNYIYFSFILLYMINIFTESMMKTQSGVVFYAFFNTLLGLHFSRNGDALTKS